MEHTSRFVPVHTLDNRFEADVLMDALQQEGITAFLKSFEETAYTGLFVPQRGWGVLMVANEQALRARQIIAPLLQKSPKGTLFENPSEIDPLLWEQLREADPESVAINARVRYDRERAAYRVPFLDTELWCIPEQEKIEVTEPNPYHKLDFEIYLAVLHYLLGPQAPEPAGEWISEKELPGGELFFRGYHQVPAAPVLEFFGENPGAFRKASERLGGEVVPMGDVAYRFSVFPGVPLLLILWQGDDEFEPAMDVLFDGTIALRIPKLDVVLAIVNTVGRSLKAAAQAP